jgi:hypothetical protein
VAFKPEAGGRLRSGNSAGEKNTHLMQRAALAQVWMDHICVRPAAASGFRLTLKDGAEPSLGASGPEKISPPTSPVFQPSSELYSVRQKKL